MRPRYGRIVVASLAAVVTVVALLGATGLYPTDEAGVVAQPIAASEAAPAEPAAERTAPAARAAERSAEAPATEPAEEPAEEPAPSASAPAAPSPKPAPTSTQEPDPAYEPLPEGSGSGTRVVFSESRQRVWLVRGDDDDEAVLRTYPVSGSTLDNLFPGTYQVYSRSRHAIGIDDSGTMEYFVRFTQGTSGAAIGFHTIPVKDGRPLQSRAELGSPRSHGCIRQARGDAVALWRFAPEGTTVVVTA
ncbi:L,D-transpeptidase [Nocardioides sp. YIM 152588]|uniref:L,D-transpeptidase n=1 Tax=Nocardioides sp. YIM 152588 TaxID=3158259 RepID=UPI0032E437EF